MELKEEIAGCLSSAEKLLIVSHVIPDGDCLGSALALALSLMNIGKKVMLFNEDPVPELYGFLPGSKKILSQLPRDLPETIVVVDSSDLERTGGQLTEKLHGKIIINIDHHVSNKGFGSFNYVNTKAASTGELVYELLILMGKKITPEVATNLYTAIVTDSGSFQYESVKPRTLEIAAQLQRAGADLPLIRKNLWENTPLKSIRLLARVLPEMCISEDGTIAWLSISKAVQDELGAESEHCEGLINYPRSIAGVEIGILFREIEKSVVKVGFRSKSKIDVNALAARFGGGGHFRAAGCTIKGELDNVVKEVVAAASASICQEIFL